MLSGFGGSKERNCLGLNAERNTASTSILFSLNFIIELLRVAGSVRTLLQGANIETHVVGIPWKLSNTRSYVFAG
jgi:hypothetical protein